MTKTALVEPELYDGQALSSKKVKRQQQSTI